MVSESYSLSRVSRDKYSPRMVKKTEVDDKLWSTNKKDQEGEEREEVQSKIFGWGIYGLS